MTDAVRGGGCMSLNKYTATWKWNGNFHSASSFACTFACSIFPLCSVSLSQCSATTTILLYNATKAICHRKPFLDGSGREFSTASRGRSFWRCNYIKGLHGSIEMDDWIGKGTENWNEGFYSPVNREIDGRYQWKMEFVEYFGNLLLFRQSQWVRDCFSISSSTYRPQLAKYTN